MKHLFFILVIALLAFSTASAQDKSFVSLSYKGYSVEETTLNGGGLDFAFINNSFLYGGGFGYNTKSESASAYGASAEASVSRTSFYGTLGFGKTVYAAVDAGAAVWSAAVNASYSGSSYSANASETYFFINPKVMLLVNYFTATAGYSFHVTEEADGNFDGFNFSVGIAIPL